MTRLSSGDIVEVLSESEIIATLDEDGTLEKLPFMPEMQKFCNRRFRIEDCVYKLIVEGLGVGIRRMRNAVILEGVKCDGEAHEGCQRTCPILWKEAWLRKIETSVESKTGELMSDTNDLPRGIRTGIASCQSMRLIEATSSLPIWDIRQYIWDIFSGKYKPLERLQSIVVSLLVKILRFLGIETHLKLRGRLKRTPTMSLDLRSGDFVRVKSEKEILMTLDQRGRNRGLEFTPEMLKYCGRRYKVLKRLDKMLIEATGKMRQIANTVILEGVTCDGKAHGGCQRNCYCMWREIWLRKSHEQ